MKICFPINSKSFLIVFNDIYELRFMAHNELLYLRF